MSTRTKNFDETYFDTIDTQEKAYLLGFLYADGYVKPKTDQRGGYINIELAKRDLNHLRKIAGILGVSSPKYKESRESYAIRINSNHMTEALTTKGIVPHRSVNGVVKAFSCVPREHKNHFVRGIFDGDGSVFKTKRSDNPQLSITDGGEEMLEVLSLYFNMTAHVPWKKLFSNGQDRQGSCLRYEAKSHVPRVAKAMYRNSTIALQRKLKRCTDWGLI